MHPMMPAHMTCSATRDRHRRHDGGVPQYGSSEIPADATAHWRVSGVAQGDMHFMDAVAPGGMAFAELHGAGRHDAHADACELQRRDDVGERSDRLTTLSRSSTATPLPGSAGGGVTARFSGAPRSSTRSAIAALAGSPAARSPSTTPARSAAGRFWLTFHLPFDARDRDLDPDDPLDLRLDERRRRVADRPRLGAARFLLTRQRGDLCGEPVAVLDRPHRARGLHNGVVPGRHDFAGLALGLVPGGRDVASRRPGTRRARRRSHRSRATADWRAQHGP